mmetsp:Transcript_8829/g.23388  ORF Transcript_8829/g.23388 Transcript_8829/m.23388 type:complete len:387 (+) Transcript_8829:28-1188(+)
MTKAAALALGGAGLGLLWLARRRTEALTAAEAARSEEMAAALRRQLAAALSSIAARTEPSERCIILSGGVDTCAILACAKDIGVTFAAAITVLTGSESPDRHFAIAAAAEHSLPHHIVEVTSDALVDTYLPACVKLLATFDGMTLRNSLVVAAAMRKAAALGKSRRSISRPQHDDRFVVQGSHVRCAARRLPARGRRRRGGRAAGRLLVHMGHGRRPGGVEGAARQDVRPVDVCDGRARGVARAALTQPVHRARVCGVGGRRDVPDRLHRRAPDPAGARRRGDLTRVRQGGAAARVRYGGVVAAQGPDRGGLWDHGHRPRPLLGGARLRRRARGRDSRPARARLRAQEQGAPGQLPRVRGGLRARRRGAPDEEAAAARRRLRRLLL